ncbi:MAG: vanadium-dependent haloperoxidase, partial [Myxococcota bacterium]
MTKDVENRQEDSITATDRRNFFRVATGAFAGAAALSQGGTKEAHAEGESANPGRSRGNKAFRTRVNAAKAQRVPFTSQPINDDDARYPDRIASFTKTLPHNHFGEVDRQAYDALLRALARGRPGAFERIPAGGSGRLANPQAAFAYCMEGADGWVPRMIAAPAFRSRWQAAEMAEVYWHAVLRDVAFADYDRDSLAQEAIADLSNLSDYRGPKVSGQITPQTLFRGTTPGDLIGPYISQFLYKTVPFGLNEVEQRYRFPIAGNDYMTDHSSWLAVQNGVLPSPSVPQQSERRYIQTARDLGEFVHLDFTYQAYLQAATILLGFGGGAVSDFNVYTQSTRQGGFITQGGGEVLDVVAKVALYALKAAWYQKWIAHRRLRPEMMSGRVHFALTQNKPYEISNELLNSAALDKVYRTYGTYFLPMAYPEGSPTHPAYPAGHATVAGACCTVLKAFFNNDFEIPNPQVPSRDGLQLENYTGSESLTIGNELNKLAFNISLGRDLAGLRYRRCGSER